MTANVLSEDPMGNEETVEKKNPGCLALVVKQLGIAASVLVFAALFKWWLPWTIPVDLFFVWKLQGTWSDWAWAILPALFAGLMVNILIGIKSEVDKAIDSHWRRFQRSKEVATPEEQQALRATPWHEEEETEEKEKPTETESPGDENEGAKPETEGHSNGNGEKKKKTRIARIDPGFLLGRGLVISTFAGIFEEISYRWIILLDLMPLILALNFVTCGLIQTLHIHVFGPVANFLTFGYLEEYIFFADGWQFGFAMLWSALRFKNGHNYQPWLGRTSAWFFGMYMFGITMTYGLPIAMLAHFLNNFVVSLYSASTASSERMRQVAKNMAEKQELEQALEAAEKKTADPADQPMPGLTEEGPPPVSSPDPKDWT